MSSHIQGPSVIDTNVNKNPIPPTKSDASADKGFELFGSDGLTFFDVIDMVNPLQQIPLVGQLYRRFTGDDLDPGSRVIGGALYFGPIGAAAAVVNVAVDETTGKDIGEHMISMIDDAGTLSPDDASESIAAFDQGQSNDPVSSWATEELAYRNRLAGSPDMTKGIETAAVDPVTLWAQQELGVRQTRPSDIQVSQSQISRQLPVQTPIIDDKTMSVAEFMVSQQQPPEINPLQAVAAYQIAKIPVTKISDGRVAPAGGWFSAAMIDAANKSEDIQGLKQKQQFGTETP